MGKYNQKNNVKVCWGTPDTVMYVDKNGQEHEIDYSPYGYTFGIWDGICITSNDNADTAGLTHDDLIVNYVYSNGWKNVLSPYEAYGNEYSWDEYSELPVKYDGEEDKVIPSVIRYQTVTFDDDDDTYYNMTVTDMDGNEEDYEEYDEYALEDLLPEEAYNDLLNGRCDNTDEEGWKTVRYQERETYWDFVYNLGSPVLRGRILMDFDTDLYNPPTFIALWDEDDITPENIKKLQGAWGKAIYDYFLVTETNPQSASRYGLFNMPTLREWMNGETNYTSKKDAEEKERLKCLHLMKPEEKHKYNRQWMDAHNAVMYDKLAYRDHEGNIRTDKEPMTLAQYHNMIYQEGKDRKLTKVTLTESQLHEVIKESVSKIINEISSQFIQDRLRNTWEDQQNGFRWNASKNDYEDIEKKRHQIQKTETKCCRKTQ